MTLYTRKQGKAVSKYALMRENLSSGFGNNAGAGQPAHPRSLISTFVIRFLEVPYVNFLQVNFNFLASLFS